MLRHQLRQVSPGGALDHGKDQIVMLDGSCRTSCTQLRTTLTKLCTSMLSTLLSNHQLTSSLCNTNGTTRSPSQLPLLLSFISAGTSAFGHHHNVSSLPPPPPPCHSCRYQMRVVVVGCRRYRWAVVDTRWDGGGCGGNQGGLRRGRSPGEVDGLFGDALEEGYDGDFEEGGHGVLLVKEVTLAGEPPGTAAASALAAPSRNSASSSLTMIMASPSAASAPPPPPLSPPSTPSPSPLTLKSSPP